MTVMNNASFSFRLPEDLKREAFNVIEQYGFTPSQVFNVFLTEIAKTKSVPINLGYLKPNEDTLKAIAEIENGEAERYRIADVDVSKMLLAMAGKNDDDDDK